MFTLDPYGGQDIESLTLWVIQQFQKLSNLHTELETDSLRFTRLHVAPTRPATDTIYLADGSDWDPLSVGGSDPYFVWYTGSVYRGLHETGNGTNLT